MERFEYAELLLFPNNMGAGVRPELWVLHTGEWATTEYGTARPREHLPVLNELGAKGWLLTGRRRTDEVHERVGIGRRAVSAMAPDYELLAPQVKIITVWDARRRTD